MKFIIDGRARIREDSRQYSDMLFSVKSSNVNSGMIRDFRGAIARENAAAGVFITLKEPNKDMKQEAGSAGFYSNHRIASNPYMCDIEKIKIVTVEHILAGERLNVPLAVDVLKKAAPASSTYDSQISFAFL